MGDIDQAQIHVTAWPGVPLSLPQTYRVESKLTAAEVIVPCPRGQYGRDWEEEAVPLNGETYLRLASVDLDDPEAIFAFVAEYGTLGGADAYHAVMREAAYAFANMYRAQLDATTEQEKRERALREAETRTPDSVWPSDTLKFYYTETLDEFRFAARFLRDLTSAWLMFKEGTPASDVDWVSPGDSDPAFLQEDGFPLFLLSTAFPNWFLRSFSPRLTFSWTPPLPPGPAFSDLPPRQGGINIEPMRRPIGGPLYAICALELYNHMVENAKYLICANENCVQKHFVHQQGDAEKAWHRRDGVLYCTPACAHAKANRDYRRRKKGS